MSQTLDSAESVVAAAKERANELGVAVCVAVVDASGVLVAFARQDGALLVSDEFAVGKAYTAAAMRLPTCVVRKLFAPGGALCGIPPVNPHRPLVPVAGGVPIGDPVVAAVGVSGGTPEQDGDIALRGAGAWSPDRRP